MFLQRYEAAPRSTALLAIAPLPFAGKTWSPLKWKPAPLPSLLNIEPELPPIWYTTPFEQVVFVPVEVVSNLLLLS